jgi:hypothetical protein
VHDGSIRPPRRADLNSAELCSFELALDLCRNCVALRGPGSCLTLCIGVTETQAQVRPRLVMLFNDWCRMRSYSRAIRCPARFLADDNQVPGTGLDARAGSLATAPLASGEESARNPETTE